jgi:septal ring factor EnvC (AmiA/AmiB activator)
MNITRFISWLTLVSFVVVAGCTGSKPNSEQRDQLVIRISALEQQVHSLEVSNAEFQKQLRALQPQPTADQVKRDMEEFQKRLQEARKNAREQQQNPLTPRSQPPINQEPHLTPLDTKPAS